MGEILKYEIQKNIVVMVISLIMIVPILGSDTWFNKVADMEPTTCYYMNLISNDTNPDVNKAWLMSFIDASLNSSRPLSYFQAFNVNFSIDSSLGFDKTNLFNVSDLRASEKISLSNSTYSTVFSKKK